MANWVEQFFRRESSGLEEKIRPAVLSGDLETVFSEFRLLRLRMAEAIRNVLPPFGQEAGKQEQGQDLIELQTQMNIALDGRLREAVKAIIEHRAEALAEAARRDPITGLLNRAAFNDRLHDEFIRARRYNRELSLVLLDVDCLKSVNDHHGHLAGDEVLLNIARIIKSSLRQSDATFRFGGDEFAAICPETPIGALSDVMRRIETNIRFWATENRVTETIGISWGLATFQDLASKEEIDEYELIRIADRQLYLCKKVHHKQLAAQR